MPRYDELEKLATRIVGDGHTPNLYIVTDKRPCNDCDHGRALSLSPLADAGHAPPLCGVSTRG